MADVEFFKVIFKKLVNYDWVRCFIILINIGIRFLYLIFKVKMVHYYLG